MEDRGTAGRWSGRRAVLCIGALCAVFAVGFFLGRVGGVSGFSVETQYAVGAVKPIFLEMSDGQREAETAQAEPGTSADMVNINTAGETELMTLPGIGQVLAQRIIAHREEHGGFTLIDEIRDVSGIGEQIFNNIQSSITVD